MNLTLLIILDNTRGLGINLFKPDLREGGERLKVGSRVERGGGRLET
jgi:hypothetical protein